MVLTTVCTSLWSASEFSRLSSVVDKTLRDRQKAIDSAAALAGTLEREDDSLLLAVGGQLEEAQRQLSTEMQRGDEQLNQLLSVIRVGDKDEISLASQLRHEMDSYRNAGAQLMHVAGEPAARQQYHDQINPLLRQAVSTCARLRELNFKEMHLSGLRARDEASRATFVVIVLSLAAVLFASIVAVWLARSILLPLRQLSISVEAVRQGNFDHRVKTESADELGQLARGFNRMAESLAEYRRSSLGELLAAKSTLESILHALPDAVLVIAPDGRLVAVNPPGAAVLEAQHARGASRFQDLPFLPDHVAAVNDALAGKSGQVSRTDFRRTLTVMLDRRLHKFLVLAVPIPQFDSGKTGAIVVLDDVTEFVRLDELRSELIGIASHELKTPLTTVKMNLLLLGEATDKLKEREGRILDSAVAACEELAATIDELLDVTRIESGRLKLDLALVDMFPIVEQALKRLQPRFDDAGIQVRIQRECEHAPVRADASRMTNVITNLLSNALKYSPPGSTITIRIGSGQITALNSVRTVQIAVTDSGPGVPPELRQRIFEKFFRVEDHVNRHQEGVRGTGIGLYLCREIIKAHGGSIECVAGDDGSGARVQFALPRSIT